MRRLLISFYLKTFGNKLSLKTNILNIIYFFIGKFIFRFQNILFKTSDQSKQILDNGYFIKNHSNLKGAVHSISSQVVELLKNEENLELAYEKSGLIHLKNSLIHFPELIDLLYSKEVSNIIHGFLGTDFQIFSSNIYRTTKSVTKENKFSILHYHFDSMPSSHLKVMIYLHKVDEKGGALKVVNRQKSIELRGKGFWERKSKDFQNIIIDNTKVLEGKEGTFIYFYPHDTIHKATLPEIGNRDIVNFVLIPSIRSKRVLTEDRRHFLSNNLNGYCANPFTF
tara:strand:+ start:3663 stop:4508 length:846 start_codon:yes stop_codon:yes gene_type:complete